MSINKSCSYRNLLSLRNRPKMQRPSVFSGDKCWKNVGQTLRSKGMKVHSILLKRPRICGWLAERQTEKRAVSIGMCVRWREDHFYFREFVGEALMFPSSALLPISAEGDTNRRWTKFISSTDCSSYCITISKNYFINQNLYNSNSNSVSW